MVSTIRERPFIEKVNKKMHLPPPPFGKTIGHGLNNKNEFG